MVPTEAAMIAVAALVVGVLIAGHLHSLWGWIVQTTGRLLLVAAIVAIVWLVLRPAATQEPSPSSGVAWWE
jgi:hypothetical protein